MSSQRNPRLTTRQASAQEQRRAMNERRQKFTTQIRKQKKSDWLAQKRGVDTGSGAPSTTPVDLSQSILAFLKDPPVPGSLLKMRAALQAAPTSHLPNGWSLDDPTHLEQAKQLIQRIGTTLQHVISSPTIDSTVAIICVQTLHQIASLSVTSLKSSTGTSSDGYYYGRHAPTWSELLLEEPTIASSLPRLLALPELSLVEHTCWFLGHWAQDLPTACPRWRTELGLVAALAKLFGLLPTTTTGDLSDPTTAPGMALRFRVVQAALWAFVHLLKGDATASGWDYCQPTLFHPPLANQLLTISIPNIPPELETSCMDISVQTTWIVVHLSQREDAVVDVLLQTDAEGTDLLRTILERLYQVCEGAAQQQQQSLGIPKIGQLNYFHHPLLEPCLEVMGHWSTACNGKHVPRLLSKTSATSRVQQEISLLPLLEKLIRWGHQGLLQTSDYLQLLWLSGCLLCDAGTQQHPSTSLAAPSLIPLLSQGLQDNPSASQSNSLECKREGVLALWNAINAPPSNDPQQQQQLQRSSFFQETLMVVLQLILTCSNNAANANTNSSYLTLMALKQLLLCQDVDAMVGAMHIINVILRTIPSTRVTFMEVDGDEALEAVCDLPLGNDQASTEAADMAAELIDDFFDSDRLDGNDEDQFADPVLQPAQAGGTFVFGLDTVAQQNAPIFMPTLQADDDDAPMHAPVLSVGSEPVDLGIGRGHGRGGGKGRGRGHVLPAWAAQQQHL